MRLDYLENILKRLQRNKKFFSTRKEPEYLDMKKSFTAEIKKVRSLIKQVKDEQKRGDTE